MKVSQKINCYLFKYNNIKTDTKFQFQRMWIYCVCNQNNHFELNQLKCSCVDPNIIKQNPNIIVLVLNETSKPFMYSEYSINY